MKEKILIVAFIIIAALLPVLLAKGCVSAVVGCALPVITILTAIAFVAEKVVPSFRGKFTNIVGIASLIMTAWIILSSI